MLGVVVISRCFIRGNSTPRFIQLKNYTFTVLEVKSRLKNKSHKYLSLCIYSISYDLVLGIRDQHPGEELPSIKPITTLKNESFLVNNTNILNDTLMILCSLSSYKP